MDKRRAVYIERCTYSSGASIRKPTVEIQQGTECLAYNFAKISLTSMLTVGAGRGIRFNIVVQSFSQIEEKYGKEQTETAKDNCHCLIYIRSENPNTNAEISKRLGKYTTSSYGRSNSTNKNGNSSASMNLIGRELLMPEELNKIARPYLIVMLSGQYPAMMQLPDISKWLFNTMLGMGNKEHNIALRLYRQNNRPNRKMKPLALWGIWQKYKEEEENEQYRNKEEQKQQNSTIPPLHDMNDFPENAFDDLDDNNISQAEEERIHSVFDEIRSKQIDENE